MSEPRYWPRPTVLGPHSHGLAVVDASAGTGKTFFLEHRVVDLILDGAAIDQIVVVTFTEKATYELKGRIRHLLGEMLAAPPGPPPPHHWVIDDASRRRLRDALGNFDRAAISTIHGFCQRVLVEEAFASRRLLEQTQIADDAAFHDAFVEVVRCQLAVDPATRAWLEVWLEGGGKIAQLEEVLLACSRKSAPIRPTLDPAALRAAVRGYLTAYQSLGPRLEQLGAKISVKKTLFPALHQVARALAAIDEGADLEFTREVFRALDGATGVRDALKTIDHRLFDKHLARDPGPLAPLLVAAETLCRQAISLTSACAQVFLPRIEEHLRIAKERRGLFDYQDLVTLLADALTSPTGEALAARIRQRHPWALVDEFQDTDHLQWSIFRRIWMSAEARGLTVVGDPKQAIYSFRGADLAAYQGACRDLRGDGARSTELLDNYRSSSQLVAAVNHLVAQAPFALSLPPTRPVRAASAVVGHATRPEPVVLVEVPQGPGTNPFTGFGEGAIEWFADEIARLLRDPAHRLEIDDGKRRRAIDAGDIFVLTRTGGEVDLVAAALRARAIPCAAYQREHLLSSPEAAAVSHLLDALASPRDRAARLRAALTPFFALTLDDLPELGEADDNHPVVAQLGLWRALAVRRDYEHLFADILSQSRLTERALLLGTEGRTVTNALHVFELLQEEIARSRCAIDELARRVRNWVRDGDRDHPSDSDVQRIETDRRCVQITTIHRAKGLEAAVVFVVGHAAPFRTDKVRTFRDTGDLRCMAVQPGEEHSERSKREQAEEAVRLCYVAVTRAKLRLYLPWVDTDRGAHDYQAIHATIREAAHRPELAGWFRREVAPPPVEVETTPPDLAGFACPPAPPVVAISILDDSQRGVAVESYSALKRQGELDRDAFRDDLLVPRAEQAPPGELPAGAATGIFLHELLEKVDFSSLRHRPDLETWSAMPAVARLFAETAARHQIAAEHLGHARSLVHRCLGDEVAIGGRPRRLCDAAQVRREVEFVFPMRRGFIKGFIDLLVRWPDDRRVWVIDYKSDVLPGFGLAEAETHATGHYGLQRKLYGVAAARMLADPAGERIGGLAFWFLRPQLVVDQPITAAELEAWSARLEAGETP